MNAEERKAREKALKIDKDKAKDKCISDLIRKMKKCGFSDEEIEETFCRASCKKCPEICEEIRKRRKLKIE